jgi:uncharacterized membrane protein
MAHSEPALIGLIPKNIVLSKLFKLLLVYWAKICTYLSEPNLKPMKNILFAALLGSASALVVTPVVAVAAPAQTTPAAGEAPSAKEMKKIRKARKQTGPEVYKGTVAEQSRIVTDAPGAEKEDGDATSKKEQRKMKKNK